MYLTLPWYLLWRENGRPPNASSELCHHLLDDLYCLGVTVTYVTIKKGKVHISSLLKSELQDFFGVFPFWGYEVRTLVPAGSPYLPAVPTDSSLFEEIFPGEWLNFKS